MNETRNASLLARVCEACGISSGRFARYTLVKGGLTVKNEEVYELARRALPYHGLRRDALDKFWHEHMTTTMYGSLSEAKDTDSLADSLADFVSCANQIRSADENCPIRLLVADCVAYHASEWAMREYSRLIIQEARVLAPLDKEYRAKLVDSIAHDTLLNTLRLGHADVARDFPDIDFPARAVMHTQRLARVERDLHCELSRYFDDESKSPYSYLSYLLAPPSVLSALDALLRHSQLRWAMLCVRVDYGAYYE